MKKYFLYIIVLFLFSCTKNFEELNTDPNQFTEASPEAILAGAIRSTNDQMATNNSSSYWDLTHTIAQQANRYSVTDNGLWQTSYVNVLENLKQLINQYGDNPLFNNRVQIARIWQCHVYSILVGQYGPVPLSQANNPDYLSAVMFDSEDSVYTYILSTLKDAADKMKLSDAKDKLTYDVVYGGDLLKWKKFANTLRLKVALRCTRNLGDVAKKHVSEVMADEATMISSEAETAKMNYENVNNNENPYYRKFVRSGSYYPYTPSALGVAPKLSDFLLTFFRSYKDPRLKVYFDSVKVGDRLMITDTLTSSLDNLLWIVSYPVPYLGIPKSNVNIWSSLNGQPSPLGTNVKSFSNVTPALYDPARPFIIMSFAEALFLKAEAKLLDLGGSNSAEAYYYEGIDANFAYWGLPASAANAYKSVDGIKWGTIGKGFNNFLGIVNTDVPRADINKIWIQSWLNYFPDQAFDSWCLQRRTRVLNFPPHTYPATGWIYQDLPNRGYYPVSVSSLNPQGYADALIKLGSPSFSDESMNPYNSLRFMAPYAVPDWSSMNAAYDISYLQKWYGNTIQSLQSAAVKDGFTFQIIRSYEK